VVERPCVKENGATFQKKKNSPSPQPPPLPPKKSTHPPPPQHTPRPPSVGAKNPKDRPPHAFGGGLPREKFCGLPGGGLIGVGKKPKKPKTPPPEGGGGNQDPSGGCVLPG